MRNKEAFQRNVVRQSLSEAKRSMRGVFGFSFVVNLLLLTSPMFMLQVYDRVLLSRSESTLVGLIAIALFLLGLLLCFEIIRNFLLNRISVRFDQGLSAPVLFEMFKRGSSMQPMHDLNTVRNFIANPYLLALFDIPWLPAYLAVVYMLHPALGHVGLVGALILFVLALVNDRLTRDISQASNEAFGAADDFVEHGLRNKDAAMGMGMFPALLAQWRNMQSAGLGYQALSTDRNAWIGAIAKVVRQIVQIAVLATGAYLAIQDITTAGAMIAASIIIGRALTPIEQSIQGWRGFGRARESSLNLAEFMEHYQPLDAVTPLPEPEGAVQLANVLAFGTDEDAQTGASPIIKNVSLSIKAGELVGLTGPSGSGKTTLARLILGVHRATAGTIRIDGAELTPENQAQISGFFGYLPQDVELFDGTVAENIARFRGESGEDVVKAAMLAGAHELILALPQGYETRVGPGGIAISGGQKQRIGLARALFGSPRLIVLDEPSSNLDNSGRQCVIQTLEKLKQRGITCLVIAHQPSLFTHMDKVALVAAGQIQKFGPRDEVFQELSPTRTEEKTAQSAPLKGAPSVVSSGKAGSARVVQARSRAPVRSSGQRS